MRRRTITVGAIGLQVLDALSRHTESAASLGFILERPPSSVYSALRLLKRSRLIRSRRSSEPLPSTGGSHPQWWELTPAGRERLQLCLLRGRVPGVPGRLSGASRRSYDREVAGG